jgi:formamidopyrimidine-DNA glycosylase
MPELPEVEWCRRALHRWTEGRRVVRVEVLDGRVIRGSRTARPTAGMRGGRAALEGVVLAAAGAEGIRHGKRLLWPFGERALLLHLGMTGKWTRRDAAHAKVRLHLDAGPPLTYADPRLLGGIVPTTLAAGTEMLHDGLGPDALGLHGGEIASLHLRGTRPVKVALLDQAVIAGLGNLHAAEALWRASVDPRVPCDQLTARQRGAISAGIHAQLDSALRTLSGDDEITYVEDPGAPNPFSIYDREDEPCPRCGHAIERMVQAGRSTYWCPRCQRRLRRDPSLRKLPK